MKARKNVTFFFALELIFQKGAYGQRHSTKTDAMAKDTQSGDEEI